MSATVCKDKSIARRNLPSAVPALRGKNMRSIVKVLSFTIGFVLFASSLFAQCDNKTGFAKLACQAQANSSPAGLPPGVGDPKTAPISTGLADAIHLDTLPSTVDPQAFRPLMNLDRTDDGAFILKAGIYEAYVQSYALDAGDVNASKPGGYYPAPIKGKKAKILTALLKYAELHTDVPQADIQQLVWVVVGNVDLEKMNPAVQQTAARVLPQEILKQMQGAAQAKAFQDALMNMLNQRIAKDKSVQQNLDKMNNAMKQIQQQTAGLAPGFKSEADADAPVARGTWAQMPGGFFVRYLPDGYMKTRVQVIVPDKAIEQADPKTPLTFDPTQYLAILCQAPGERIGITLRPADAKR
jgi:hypothetical protein